MKCCQSLGQVKDKQQVSLPQSRQRTLSHQSPNRAKIPNPHIADGIADSAEDAPPESQIFNYNRPYQGRSGWIAVSTLVTIMSHHTDLAFQRNGHLSTLQVTVIAVKKFATLEQDDRDLFKQGQDDDPVILTDATIFHPQGGGQPSDVGVMEAEAGPSFQVHTVRMSSTSPQEALHFGRFSDPSSTFQPGQTVTQTIDSEKRLLYSRYHTAGHVLGAAVRHLLEKEIENFDETKASHFPDSAACEFRGLIEGRWKEAIQARLDEYVERDMPVEIDWWDEEEFRANGLERLTPDREAMGLGPGEKFRVVKIVGAETYPCGGTHVESTKLCGATKVKKISRSKGTSRVGYYL